MMDNTMNATKAIATLISEKAIINYNKGVYYPTRTQAIDYAINAIEESTTPKKVYIVQEKCALVKAVFDTMEKAQAYVKENQYKIAFDYIDGGVDCLTIKAFEIG